MVWRPYLWLLQLKLIARLDGVRIEVDNGSLSNQGILNDGGSPEIFNSYILPHGTKPQAMRSDNDAEPQIRRSTIYSEIEGNAGSSTSLSQSSFFGGLAGVGNIRCMASDNTFGNPLDEDCELIVTP
ncbi:MAG: hypothetical protein ACI9J2_001885 [Saprospiraceae bacterium]